MRALCCLLLALAWPAVAAERVVSLTPALTEIMLELGAQTRLVGHSAWSGQPAALDGLTSVGQLNQLELETLLSLKPDLILLGPDSLGASQRQQLQAFGIALYQTRPLTLSELPAQLLEIGRRVGHEPQARQLGTQLSERLQRLRATYHRPRPLRVFYQVWDQPLYTIGGRQFISDALQVCGAQNVFAELSLAAPQVSLESVLQRDPEVILTSEPQLVAAWSAWPNLTAVRRAQVWAIPDRGLERPSVQMLDATEQLCQLLQRAY